MDQALPPMGRGPGGSNDVSGYLQQAAEDYKAGRLTKQQYLDHLDRYAPMAGSRPAIPPTQIGNKVY